jgi:hypothetical protein
MSDYSGRLPHLPHRILNVGSSPASEIVLKETVEGEKEHYACLSHSWGGHQPLKTTRATLEEYKKGIAWEDLPKTFQDAVAYTRRLNLSYIWIDSLCIIQDSDEDWGREAALMADIYRNGTITLSAAASRSPNDGLFVSTLSEYQGIKLAPNWVKPPEHTPNFFTRKPLPHNRKDQPLLSRGWVLQERLLSPRVIHFGTYELIWECMEFSTCECGGPPDELHWFYRKRDFHPSVFSTLNPGFAGFAWRKVIQDFCGSMLTYQQDALPAVSGAAKLVRQSLEDRGIQVKYIAGMWDCWFVEDCLWYMSTPAARPENWRAPTFSWASVVSTHYNHLKYTTTQTSQWALRKGKMDLEMDAMTFYATLQSCERELKDSDETGRLVSASVILTGPLLEAKWTGRYLIVSGDQCRETIDWQPDYNFSVSGQYHIDPDATLWCLQLASLISPVEKPRWEYMWLLVLRQVSIERKGLVVYERVGLGRYMQGFDAKRPAETWFDRDKIIWDAVVKVV